MANVSGESADPNVAGVAGSNSADGPAIWGQAGGGRGVVGISDHGNGVWGQCRSGRAVVGAVDEDGAGVWGEAKTGTGVVGVVHEGAGAGVSGRNDTGDGVMGVGRRGVVGISDTFQGVYGKSRDNSGVVGESDQMHAVFCVAHSANAAGVFATNTAGGNAALFDGNVEVTGDLVLAGADVAEQFEIPANSNTLPAGAVAVVDDAGRIVATQQPYDCRVVGIVSGAGDRRAAIVLDRRNVGNRDAGNRDVATRQPIAMVGKAWCLADATLAPIRVGDLLTTSSRTAHAMRATDRVQAIGATIGKALTSLEGGTGQVLVLVGLR
jgi:hypothetical protein